MLVGRLYKRELLQEYYITIIIFTFYLFIFYYFIYYILSYKKYMFYYSLKKRKYLFINYFHNYIFTNFINFIYRNTEIN